MIPPPPALRIIAFCCEMHWGKYRGRRVMVSHCRCDSFLFMISPNRQTDRRGSRLQIQWPQWLFNRRMKSPPGDIRLKIFLKEREKKSPTNDKLCRKRHFERRSWQVLTALCEEMTAPLQIALVSIIFSSSRRSKL